MMLPKPLVSVAGVVLGSLGIAVCLALIVVFWVAGNRLGRAPDRLFSSAERALIACEERLVRTQERIALAKSSAEDIENSLVDWTNQDAGQRQVLKQAVVDKSEKLAYVLEQIDLWLEAVESPVGHVGELLTSVDTGSPSTGTASVVQLRDEFTALRSKVAEAITAVARIQEWVNDPNQALLGPENPLARRVLAPLSSMDARFVTVERRLSATRGQLQELNAGVQRWILIVTIAATLILLWMAAGQAALGWLAWTVRYKT